MKFNPIRDILLVYSPPSVGTSFSCCSYFWPDNQVLEKDVVKLTTACRQMQIREERAINSGGLKAMM